MPLRGDQPRTPAILGHLLTHLGEPIAQAHEDRGGIELPFLILTFPDQPHKGCLTYVTLGLGRHVFEVPDGGTVRQELLLSVRDSYHAWNVKGIIACAGEEYLMATHRALLNGEVLGPRGRLWPGSAMEALYCTTPGYFPDSFDRCLTTDPPTVLVSLYPLYREEASALRSLDADDFAELVTRQGIDLLDLKRPALILPASHAP